MGALAVCLLLLQGPTPPRNPAQEAVAYLLAHQGADGSWGGAPSGCTCRKPTVGGDLETTARTILALVGAGYTELSPETLNGRPLAQVVRSGLEWLVSRQDKEGAFDRGDTAVNALAALAVIEHYGFTELRKAAAEKAYAWVEKAEVKGVVPLLRQGMVVHTAMLSDLGKGHDAKLARLAEMLATEKGDLARYGTLLLKAFGRILRYNSPSFKIDPGDPLQLPMETLYVFSSATFLLSYTEDWHKWFRRASLQVYSLQSDGRRVCETGSWEGETVRDRVRTTALRFVTAHHLRCFDPKCFSPKK
jgi:hypothetical protein